MASTISLVPIQALTSTNIDGVQMTGPFILVKTTTVAQQMQAQRRLKKQEFVSKEPELPGRVLVVWLILRFASRPDDKVVKL
jgi:hypothetical protein